MKYLAIILMAAAAPAMAQKGPSFPCSKATTTTERTICAVPRLAAMDEALASAYRSAGASNIGAGAARALRDEQRKWLRARDACGADVACLEASYRARADDICSIPVITGVHWHCAEMPD